ncbi:MAG: type II toxin-antitoxin system mRNA interferase toxin, RelE/StbE family [Chlamydiae bacterium]|nr:type II toxin-antitoxin system mRNA interferase toxin, RelE/StbE family [Chlamydiota bacterium]MBI3266367.1 type II toxin-antitoxin system mRNA interferase toxin, RelE/StbE family [Chlamydiota bacterium]
MKVHKKVITEDSKHFDLKTKDKIKKKCKELLSHHPEEVGEPLRFELQGYRKLKIFNDYRVVYKVEKEEVLVFILAVGIRRDLEVYEEAIKRLENQK